MSEPIPPQAEIDDPSTEETVNDATVNEERARVVEDAVSTLFGLGRLWASHGLHIGRAALQTSAVTLETTANLLGEISSQIEAEDERAA